jgi:hypothetical protein
MKPRPRLLHSRMPWSVENPPRAKAGQNQVTGWAQVGQEVGRKAGEKPQNVPPACVDVSRAYDVGP